MREKLGIRKYYTTTQAATVCHISPSTLLRAIRHKRLNAFATPGGHFRVAHDDLQAFLNSSRLTASSSATAKHRILIAGPETPALRRLRQTLEADPAWDVRSSRSLPGNRGSIAGFQAEVLAQGIPPKR